jgi:protein-tyrosine phosphatase
MILNQRVLWILPVLLISGCITPSKPGLATTSVVGEKVPSEDPVIGVFHTLGIINGQDHLYRSAAPMRDLAKAAIVTPDSAEARTAAATRMKRLYARGIRTVISLENVDPTDKEDQAAWIALEKSAAKDVGINFVSYPMANSGANSIQDATDQAVLKQLQAVSDELFNDAKSGGVLIHCSAGHDRTGIVVAYLRLKYEQWTVDRAIEDMRSYGHNWIKYSSNGGVSSWHEDHLRAIAKLLAANSP